MFKSIIKLLKHSAIYGIGHILSRSIGFLLLPLHTNYITPDEYAIYVYGYAFIPFIAIFYSAGINTALLRYYILEKGDHLEKFKIVSSSFLITLMISISLSAIFLIFSSEIALIVFGAHKFDYLVRLCCGILFFDALQLIFFNILRAEEKPIQYVSFNILYIAINIILNTIFIIHYHMGITGIFTANFIASFITFIILLFVLRKNIHFEFSTEISTRLIRFGFPLIPSILSMVLLTMSDRFIIRELMGNEAAGLYGAAYKLGMFMSLIVTAFRYAWHPYYLSIANEDANAKMIFSKVLTYFVFFCGLIFLIISLFIDDIVHIKLFGMSIFGEEYWDGIRIVPLILASYIFYGIYLNFQVGIYLKNKTGYLAFITLLSAILNICTNFLFIPKLGIMGAAFATLIAYIFMAMSLYLYSNKIYPISYEWLRVSKVFITCFLLYIAGVYSYVDKPGLFKLIFVIAYFIILYFIGFFEKKEITKIKELIR